MNNFCAKCGSRLNPENGSCPKCSTESKTSSFSEISKQRKRIEKTEKKQKNKFKRFLVKTVAILLTVAILFSAVSCALVYFDKVDIPFVESAMNFLGVKESSDEGKNGNESIGFQSSLENAVITDAQSAIEAVKASADELGLENAADELTLKKESTVNGITYYRLQQNYKGIPVYGSEVVVCTDRRGKMLITNNNCKDVAKEIPLVPTIKKELVEKNLLVYLTTNHGIADIDNIEINDLLSENLVIYFCVNDSNPVLAYVCTTQNAALVDYLIVDASTGEILTVNLAGNAQAAGLITTDDGTAVIGTYDEEKGVYQLFDQSKKIFVMSLDGNNSRKIKKNTDLSIFDEATLVESNDKIFGNESGPSDETSLNYSDAAKYLTFLAQAHDYYSSNFSESSPEGGTAIFVNDGYDLGLNGLSETCYTNDGKLINFLYFGSNRKPESDVIAHEYTHSIISRHCEIDDTNKELNAIEEGLCDFFGEVIESTLNNDKPNWTISQRNISSPGIFYPDSLDDNYFSLEDYAHDYSVIISRAGYLMHNGVEGKYTSINLDRLAQLFYCSILTLYTDMGFKEYRLLMERWAEVLGYTQEERDCISAAFDEVGIESIKKTDREVILVLDTSGSMAGDPINQTKSSALSFAETVFEEDAKVAVVTYSSGAGVSVPLSQNQTKVSNAINSIGSGGGTNIEAGLSTAYSMLKDSSAKNRIIVLMSDGLPNSGKTGESLVAYADEIKSSGISIYAMGFFSAISGSKAAAQSLMERIGSSGYHYESSDADSLNYLFGDIADQINGQKYIYIRAACPIDIEVTYNGETLSSKEDSLNMRTDFGTLTFEDAENDEDGGETTVKVLRLKEGTDYDIKIIGTGRGKMDYTIGFMDENGEYSDLRKFRNIKITRKTEIDTVASNTDKTVLNVDEDGDGRYDLKYKAGSNERGELVDYSWMLYIAIGAAALIAILIIWIKIKKRKVKNNG